MVQTNTVIVIGL